MTSPEYQAPTWVNEDDPAFIEGVSPDLGAGYLNTLSGAVEDHGQRLGAITPVVTNLQNTALDQATGDNRYILQAVAGTFAQADATTTALAGKVGLGDARLADTRTPTDNSVTDAKVAAGAAISADKLADGTTNKVLTAAERAKLAGVATAATANSTDAQLRDRATHTGAQAISTVTGLQTTLDSKQPLAAGLTALAGLDSATAGTVASDGAGWVKKTYAQMRTALGLATIATSGKLADATDLTVTGAAVGSVLTPTAIDGSGTPTAHGYRAGTGVLNVKDYGAKGDGTTNDTAAFQAWLASGATSGFVPPGIYIINATLTQPVTMNVSCDPAAVLKAGTVIAGPMWDTPVDIAMDRRGLSGGTFDCNGLAQTGIYLRRVQHFRLTDVTVLNPTSHSVILGDPAAASNSYECMVHNLNVWRPSGQAAPGGSYGLWLRNASDCEITQCIFVGAETSIRIDTGGNRIVQAHAWGFSGAAPVTCFDDNASGNAWIGCFADTPTSYGFRLRQFNTALLGCKVYVNSFYGVDNTVVGVQADQTTPLYTALGCHFQGADSTHRLARDFSSNSVTAHRIGTQITNVTTVAPQNSFAGLNLLSKNSSALNIAGDAQYVNVNSNATGFALQLVNSMPIEGYSDLYSTKRWSISSATGCFTTGRAATGSRPTAAAAGAGAQFYDTTLGKPIWSDGTAWRDAAGTIV